MAKGVFFGTVIDSSGPTLSVDRVLHGTFSDKWRDISEDAPRGLSGSWPFWGKHRDNSLGESFLVISYDPEPPGTVYRSITVLKADQDSVFDFTEVFDKSNVTVTGERCLRLSELKEMFS